MKPRQITLLQLRNLIERMAHDIRRAMKRARKWPRRAYLAYRIRSAKFDCDAIEFYLTTAPAQLHVTKAKMADRHAQLAMDEDA